MSRSSAVIAALLFSASIFPSDAPAADLKAFVANDSWTFRQEVRDRGVVQETKDINFSVIRKSPNGESLLAFAQAIMDNGQSIWSPVGWIPATSCVQDFVGNSDIGLKNSCGDALAAGREWQSSTNSEGVKQELTFRVVGNEEIEVLGKKFRATKIQGTGVQFNRSKKSQGLSLTYWFVPELKAVGRMARELRAEDGTVLSSVSEELVAAHLNHVTQNSADTQAMNRNYEGTAFVPAYLMAEPPCKPTYPKALQNGETGFVRTKLWINPQGKPINIGIVKSSGVRELDKEILRALYLCKFQPGTKDGRPTDSWIALEYEWKVD